MQKKRSNYRAPRYSDSRRVTHTRLQTKPDVGPDRISGFMKRTTLQGIICIGLLIVLFSAQMVPYDPFLQFSDGVRFVLKDQLDFPRIYENSKAFLATNLSADQMTLYRENIQAFFSGQPILDRSQAPALNLSLRRPVAGEIVAAFQADTGIVGFLAAKNEGVTAAMDGTVKEAGYSDLYNNYVVINHGDGVQTCYANLSEILVEPGSEVTRGMLVGNTSGADDQQFLFKMKKDDTYIDPAPYFEKGAASAALTGDPDAQTED